MVRGFLKVNEELDTKLPERQTKASAGYDFYVIEDVEIPAYGTVMLPTNVKAYMQEGEVLLLYVRSSIGIKRGLALSNGTGVIDADYFSNPSNDGNIGIPVPDYIEENVSTKVVKIIQSYTGVVDKMVWRKY